MTPLLKKRHRHERWFRRIGFGSLFLALLFLGGILGDIVYKGYTAFLRTEIEPNTLSKSPPQIPASSGSRESEWVKNPQLKAR